LLVQVAKYVATIRSLTSTQNDNKYAAGKTLSLPTLKYYKVFSVNSKATSMSDPEKAQGFTGASLSAIVAMYTAWILTASAT
jgi:hypothetical protein